MLAQVHAGERILPAADNRELMSRLSSPQNNSTALASELRALRQSNDELKAELKGLREETRAVATHAANTADNTRRMYVNGVLVYTDPAAPISSKEAA